MEALEQQHDPLMGFYFSCPHCKQKYVSAECVQEHSPNCHMQPSFMMPKIEFYSSLNPKAVDLNFDSGGFQIRHEIIKTEPEDYTADNHTDWQDETEDSSTLTNPGEIYQNVPSHRELELEKNGSKSKILRNSNENPHSTCKEDRYLCRYCPRTFPFPSFVENHEETHDELRKPKFSCRICGERFRWPKSLTKHMKKHEPAQMFTCTYPGCVKTFKSSVARWYHHKTHQRAGWNESGRRPGILRKNQPFKTVPRAEIIIPESEHLFLDNQHGIENYRVDDMTEHGDWNIGQSSVMDPYNKPSENAWATGLPCQVQSQEPAKASENAWATGLPCQVQSQEPAKTSENAWATGLPYQMQSQEPANPFPCCYPGCPQTFKHKTSRWIHHKIHPKGQWNAPGRRAGWNLRLKKSSNMAPSLIPESRKLLIDRKSTNQQATLNIRHKTVRAGRPANPGHEIEITTAWGRKFKCDLCDRLFATRAVARYHRLKHFDTPQVPCYMTGCSEMFFSRIQRIEHVKLVHHVRFRKGKPFIGSREVILRRTETGKVVEKEISPNVHTAWQPSHSPQKIQLNESPKPDQNIPGGSKTGRLSPGETFQFTCGVCNGNFENFHALQFHMRNHAKPNEPQVDDEVEIIGTSAPNSFGSVEFTCEGDQISVEVKDNQASYLPESSNGRSTKQVQESRANSSGRRFKRRGPAPRYPTVIIGGKKYFCCGFPGCDGVFTNRVSRYGHQKKYHNEAPRSMFKYLPRNVMSGQQPGVSEFSRQVNEDMANQMPGNVLPVALDQDCDADEPDISGMLHQSMDTLNADDSLMQHNSDFSLSNQDFKADDIAQTDDGHSVHQLRAEASTFNLNLASVNNSNPRNFQYSTTKEKVAAQRPPVKDRKCWRKGRPALYPVLQVGSTKLYPCYFPDCKGVFNSRGVRYAHLKRHRMGFKDVNSRLKLTDDGMVLDSAEGCYVIE